MSALEKLSTCSKCSGSYAGAGSKRHAGLCKRCGKSQSVALAMKGNIHSSRHSWRSFLKRRVLTRPEDRVALGLADKLAAALASDKPDASAAETALMANILTANIAATLCLAEMGRDGAFKTDADGNRVATPALKEIGRFLSEVRQGLVGLGLDRRTKSALTLGDVLKAGTPASSAVINVPRVEGGE